MEKKYSIRLAEEHRYDQIVDFIHEDFFPRESLWRGVGVTAAVPKSTAGVARFKSWLREGVSFVAIDTDTSEIAAICVNSVARISTEPQEVPQIEDAEWSCKVSSILKLIDALENGHDLFEEFNTTEGFEVCFLGVKEMHTGQGLARRLTEETLQLAKGLSYAFVKTIPTAAATRHLFEAVGFVTKCEMRLVDFVVDEVPAFPCASPDDIARFVVKAL